MNPTIDRFGTLVRAPDSAVACRARTRPQALHAGTPSIPGKWPSSVPAGDEYRRFVRDRDSDLPPVSAPHGVLHQSTLNQPIGTQP